ncbi:hypothetical protein EAE96_011090 [Botrytis aclada]|nr:hypothetical protein EAE96_011090 [Botrytis aclada]
MRGTVMTRGQAYVQLLDNIDIKDLVAIRHAVRQAITLPPIDEAVRQGIKVCVSGPISSLLGASTRSLTSAEEQAANDIQKLWKRGKRYQAHIKRLIQDCDVRQADFLVVKGVESARKYCLQAQDEERKIDENRKLAQPDANEYDVLSDKENGQKLSQIRKDACKQDKRNVTGHLSEGTTPNKKQKRKQSVAEKSPTISISAEMQDFENQEKRNEFTPINKPYTHGINNSENQAGKPNAAGSRMVNSLRDYNAVGLIDTEKEKNLSIRLTRNSQKRSENSGIGSNETIPPPDSDSPQIDSRESRNPSNSLIKELADYNKRGSNEEPLPIGKKRERRPVRQQPEPMSDIENITYTSEPRTCLYKRKGDHGGARRGAACEKGRTEREDDVRFANRKSQEDQLGSERNQIGVEDDSDNETVVRGQLDNQEEDVEMEVVQ